MKTQPFPDHDLEVAVTGRWPCRLPGKTEAEILAWPVPRPTPHQGAASPATSIVVVTCNGLVFVKLCLTSLFVNTLHPAYELILVDNASQDGTRTLVERVAAESRSVEAILNDRNRGFAAAVNQALPRASGERLILLNSDTLVPPGWLEVLLPHLESSRVGLVNPSTNRSGNLAEVGCRYRTYGEFVDCAETRRRSFSGRALELSMISMFCVGMRRDVYARLGPLDERFGMGLFEDDDYSLRSLRAGYRNHCAEDCLVHHFGQVSFGRQSSSAGYQKLLEQNRRRFERKWGRPWAPRGRRIDAKYHQLRSRIRDAVEQRLPANARVLVVSRGDAELLSLLGSHCSHFPQDRTGEYAGFHPRDSHDCIQHLESLRSRGAEYLLLPQTARWWLEHYRDFDEHLRKRYSLVLDDADTAVIFDLKGNSGPDPSARNEATSH